MRTKGRKTTITMADGDAVRGFVDDLPAAKQDRLCDMWATMMDSEKFSKIQEEMPFFNAGDDPDRLMLRFLRARKYDVDKGVAMMMKALQWRVDFGTKDIREEEFQGENLFESGQFYFHKTCLAGRPIGIIHTKLHFPKVNEVSVVQRWTIFQMEAGRRLLEHGQEKATLIFDLTGFTLANMDLGSVQFLVRCFEAYYPESLGECLVVNAPFIFWTCWKLITPLLDPVVKEKIFFVDFDQLKDHVDEKNLPTSLGGTSEYHYRYIAKEKEDIDAAAKAEVENRRKAIFKEFLEVTKELVDKWEMEAESQSDETNRLLQRRSDLKKDIEDTWYEYQKYLPKSMYHRLGIISADGRTIDWSKLQ